MLARYSQVQRSIVVTEVFPVLAEDSKPDDALAKRIAAARAAGAGSRDETKRAESASWSVATEFVGAMLAGGFIGWFIDRQFDTGPWGLIGLLLLGFVTGLRNVLRKQAPGQTPENEE